MIRSYEGSRIRVLRDDKHGFYFAGTEGVVMECDSDCLYVSFDTGNFLRNTDRDSVWVSKSDLTIIELKSKEELVEDNDQPEENAPDSITHTVTVENQTIKLSHAGLRKLKNMLTGVEL